jgi:dUTP pyrophosphatase
VRYNDKMSLYVWIPDQTLRSNMSAHLLLRRWTDSGYDLLSPQTTLDFSNSKNAAELRTGMHFAALDAEGNPVPYLLIVRSSTSLTPLRQSNNIGLADAGYRGELIARVDCVSDDTRYVIESGRRLFQVVQHNWLPWNQVTFVNRLEDLPPPPDNRGAGGFGSTGN